MKVNNKNTSFGEFPQNTVTIQDHSKKIIGNELCNFCSSKIIKRKLKTYSLINIEQKPEVRYFCSKVCKLNYINRLQEKNNLILK